VALALSVAVPARAEPDVRGWLGVVLPGHSVDVFTELPGTVARVPIGLGSLVAAGDTLAVLHAPSTDAELRAAEARVRAADAEVAARGARVDELRRVLGKRTEAPQLFTRDEIEARRSELRIAEADRSLAEARAEEARVRLAEIDRRVAGAVVRAPVRGKIARVGIGVGDQVVERQHTFQVVDTESVHVRFAVPEEELRRPAAGDTLRVLYEEAEVAVIVTTRAPLLETEAGCVVFEARPVALLDRLTAVRERSAPMPAGAVVRITRFAPPPAAVSAPAASPPGPAP
jgi:biotin carboxyl carrier protein